MRWLTALALTVVGSACTSIDSAVPVPMPECAAAEFAFVGETTLGALGLDQFGGPDSGRVGTIWVTAGPVQVDFGAPAPGFNPAPPSRMVCVQWPDGSAMAGSIDEAWQPPAGRVGAARADPSEVPWSVIALGMGAAVLIGVSIVAFRTEPAG